MAREKTAPYPPKPAAPEPPRVDNDTPRSVAEISSAPVLKRKIKRGPTIKQRRFVRMIADPASPTFGNGAASARAAGYKLAQTSATDNLGNHDVRALIERELEKRGATGALWAERMRDGLDATKVRVFCTKDGELIYSDPQVDYEQRRKYAEEIGKVRGYYPTPTEQERLRLLAIQQNIYVAPMVEKERPETKRDVEE